ncbi:hypothetical protein PRJ39_08000 [Lysobacter enzymogenes]|uniref:hypothetical protein n=1 Tax=Lysobacter enzymogenes TaxID=69 RepID=UPI0037488427
MSSCFEIETVTPYKNGFGLIGRCIIGPIRLGDSFVILISAPVSPSDNCAPHSIREDIRKINLIVQEIQYFNHSIEELQSNHAGGLYVTGLGADLLLPGFHIQT